ncbi:hypothetical protein BDV12DRAFT_210839 [Aspergillus spectabilis]
MSNVPLPPGPSTDGRSFMFVDSHADVSQAVGVGRQKKAFLSKLAHQRRKKQLQRTVLAEEHFVQIQTRRGVWSLTGYVGQVPMTDAMNMYFYHYRDHIVSSAYPLDAARMNIWWSQNAVVSPALLQTFLFLAAGHKAALESTQGVSSQVSHKSFRDAIHFRVNAIRNLNRLLHDPATATAESTIVLVSAIMTIEALNAEFNALQAHMKGLKALIGLVGGMDALNHMTLAKTYQSDVASAALQNSRPSFPISPKFRGEILQEARMFHGGASDYASEIPAALTSLGTRFARAPWYFELDSSMKYTINVCRRLLLHLEMATIIPNVVMPTDNDLYVVFQHHLVSLHYPPRKNDLNEPIRCSLLSFPAMRYMVDALRETLGLRLPYFMLTAPDLLLWILFIGGMASQGYGSHTWFDKARPVLGEFFYTDQPGQKGAEDLWNETGAVGP